MIPPVSLHGITEAGMVTSRIGRVDVLIGLSSCTVIGALDPSPVVMLTVMHPLIASVTTSMVNIFIIGLLSVIASSAK
jgi:hypothetical protein